MCCKKSHLNDSKEVSLKHKLHSIIKKTTGGNKEKYFIEEESLHRRKKRE
jgi:hypothetical protein